MKIDTEIRHVTKPGTNLFLELSFTPDEAKRLQALDCETSLKAGRGRRDFDGLAPACVRRGE